MLVHRAIRKPASAGRVLTRHSVLIGEGDWRIEIRPTCWNGKATYQAVADDLGYDYVAADAALAA